MDNAVNAVAPMGFQSFDQEIREISTRGYSLYLHSSVWGAKFLLTTYGEAWLKIYNDNSLYFLDPTVAWAISKSGTARWSQVSKDVPIGNNYVMTRAAQFDMGFGAVSSLRDSRRKKCALNVARHDRELTIEELEQLEKILRAIIDKHEAKYSVTEQDIAAIRFLADGLSQEEIAVEMSVSRDAVKKRIERIRRRLGARNTTHIVSLSIRHNILG